MSVYKEGVFSNRNSTLEDRIRNRLELLRLSRRERMVITVLSWLGFDFSAMSLSGEVGNDFQGFERDGNRLEALANFFGNPSFNGNIMTASSETVRIAFSSSLVQSHTYYAITLPFYMPEQSPLKAVLTSFGVRLGPKLFRFGLEVETDMTNKFYAIPRNYSVSTLEGDQIVWEIKRSRLVGEDEFARNTENWGRHGRLVTLRLANRPTSQVDGR